jgi:hypothetical protein
VTQATGSLANATGVGLWSTGLDPVASSLHRPGFEPPLFESGRMDSRPQKIHPQLRARCVRLVREHQQEYPNQTAAVSAVARQEGASRESVRR